MSRGQLARTPDNFPRMKHRAAGRLAKKRLRQAGDAFETFKVVGNVIGQMVNAYVDGFVAFGEAVRAAFTDPEGRALVAKIHERKAQS